MTGVGIDLYWAVGAASIGWPRDWTYIGTASMSSLAPSQVGKLALPWQPPSSGHFCFLARLHALDDPVRHEGRVSFDNNLCQKNVNVVEPTGGWIDQPGGHPQRAEWSRADQSHVRLDQLSH